jgi:hypothetical protein
VEGDIDLDRDNRLHRCPHLQRDFDLEQDRSASMAVSTTSFFFDAPFPWIWTNTHSARDSNGIHTRFVMSTNRVGSDLQIACD